MFFASTFSRSQGKAGAFLLVLITFFLCTGFKVSSVDQLRRDIRQELEKIREMTPTAKERAAWKKKEEEALRALNDARFESAYRYAPALWKEACRIFDRARKYAANKEYRKARYLARKTVEVAQMSAQKAKQTRAEMRKRCREKLDKLYVLLRKMSSKMARDEKGARTILELRLKIKDLEKGLALEQFQDVEKESEILLEKMKKVVAS